MKIAVFVFALLFPALILLAQPALAEAFATGRAYSASDGQLLYTEEHRWDEQHHSVKYLYPDGQVFATCETDFSHSFISPAYTQTYLDTDRHEGARWSGDTLTLFNGNRERAMRFQQPLVIGAGFFHFLRAHWDELLSGNTVAFEFAVPDRMSIVDLRLARVSATDSGIDDGDPDWFYFRVEATSRMLRWLTAPLNVAFDDQRRLMVLRGTSNVKLGRGAAPQVVVHYDYASADQVEAQ